MRLPSTTFTSSLQTHIASAPIHTTLQQQLCSYARTQGPRWKDPSVEQGKDQKLSGCEALERIGQLSDMHVSGEQEGTQMCFLPNKGSLCWALRWEILRTSRPIWREGNGTTHIVGQVFFF